jgi:hypothetical protein
VADALQADGLPTEEHGRRRLSSSIRCSTESIFRETISLQSLRSKRSKARELERRYSNSSPVILTECRLKLVRLVKGKKSAVEKKKIKRPD